MHDTFGAIAGFFLVIGAWLAIWVLATSPFILLGWVIGSSRNAPGMGALMGFAFGPLGCIAAFAVDNRPKCPHCSGRLPTDSPGMCMHCHQRISWVGGNPITEQAAKRRDDAWSQAQQQGFD